MYKIVCNFCGTENRFENIETRPAECSNPACQNSLDGLEAIIAEKKAFSEESITGLKLIYQKTSEQIIIKNGPKIILGRENYGSHVLGKIDQVSRTHCSIEFINNEYFVKDLGSTNGTFIGLGTDKVKCDEPQALKEKDFLVLGREVFLVQFIREEKPEETKNEISLDESKISSLKVILCTECSFVLNKIPCSCPECGTWNE